MASAKDFKNTPMTVSRVNRETLQGKGIWTLEDWGKELGILRATSSCVIKVGSDDVRQEVRFFFGSKNYSVSCFNVSEVDADHFIPLWMELKMDEATCPVIDSQVTVEIDVHELSESLEWKKELAKGVVTFKVGDKPQAQVIDKFLEYSQITLDRFYDELNEDLATQPDSLRFGINVTIPITKNTAFGNF